MIKLKAIKQFSLERYNELKNIKRNTTGQEGQLYVNDTFECNEDIAKYLLGDNRLKQKVVEIIEIVPE